jgi:dCMP deaminase
MTARPSADAVYLAQVEALRQRSTCRRGQHAALMVDTSGHVVSMGYNGSPHGEPHCLDVGCLMDEGHCVRCLHAELNMLLFADPLRAQHSTVYVTARPCFRCATALVQMGVARLVTGETAYTTDDRLLPAMLEMFARQGLVFNPGVPL